MVLPTIRRYLHMAGTAWFATCMVCVLVLSLRQANVRWMVLFPLAGPGALALLLLISIYLFAIFRGISGTHTLVAEHPITSTRYYKGFYVTTPFWGSLAGCLGTTEFRPVSEFLLTVALGSLFMTFLVWVIMDPTIGLLETMVSPSARRALVRRRAQERHEAKARNLKRETLLQQVLSNQQQQAERLRSVLEPKAKRLAGLLAQETTESVDLERQIVELGLEAWQEGGKEGMQVLLDRALELCKGRAAVIGDWPVLWWDGVGSWHKSLATQE